MKIEELDDYALKEHVKLLLDEVFVWLDSAEKCPEFADEHNDYLESALEDLKICVEELL